MAAYRDILIASYFVSDQHRWPIEALALNVC